MTKNELRKYRLTNFKELVLPGLRMIYKITKTKNSSYLIYTSQFGIIEMYPMADRVLIQEDCKWVNDGANWLCNNL